LLTGYPEQARVRFGLGAEIEELVPKPWNDDGLRLALRALLREPETDAGAGPPPAKLDARRDGDVYAQKMQVIGRLAVGIAHEINNPLGCILSNLATLSGYARELSRLLTFALSAAARLPDGDPEKEMVRVLADQLDARFLLEDFRKAADESRQGAETIRDIVRTLRAFSRADDGTTAPVDLSTVVHNALRLARNELKYKATVHCDLGPVPPLRGQALGLEQVVVNLLVNAAQAIPTRGEIFVTAGREGDEAVVRVRDTGPGIPREHLGRLFEPFFTTKPAGQGSGLGLHIAARIVRAHRGRIEARSEPGAGAEFVVRLPLE
ncbi:MAG TPA: ATP-binding protein, partial [Planctomycetota bacterium]|nr:ATP-binding protein [Planctomycetota bacterium]